MRAVRDADPRFRGNRLVVLIMLALRMNSNGAGFVSHRTLGADAGVGERTAERATREARDRGYLHQTRRGGRRGPGVRIASEWALADPYPQAAQPVTGVGFGQAATRQNRVPNPTPIGGPRGPTQEIRGPSPTSPNGPARVDAERTDFVDRTEAAITAARCRECIGVDCGKPFRGRIPPDRLCAQCRRTQRQEQPA
jgi:hypothetical protein